MQTEIPVLGEATRHAQVIADVSAALGRDLDVAANVGTLARLVLPELGTWSLVSVVDDDGSLVDAGSWHVDPERRADVARPGRARELLESLAPESCLRVPMIARGRTVGLLSVYGDTPVTPAQRALARDVAGRAALAVDNSANYQRARAARAEAEAAGQRLDLLAKASETLAGADDLEVAVGRLAQLVVPQLGDWSIVTIVDDDDMVRDTGWAHRDTDRAPDVAAYARRRSAAMTPDSPLATVLRTGEPIVIERLTEAVTSVAISDPVVAELLPTLQPYGAVLAPLISHGRVLGVLTLVTTAERGSHTAAQIQTALEVAGRAGAVLDSARSASRAQRLAESVQRSMLVVAPPGPGLQVATRYRAAYVDRQVGGDWYDTFQRPDGPTIVTIGDVMGHDVAAISSMAQLRTIMRATAWSLRQTPADVLRATDEISANLGPGTFATVLTAEVRPTPTGSAQVRYANAGHLPPAVLAADGTVRLLRTDVVDPPLGVRPGIVRHDHVTVLQPGDTLVLYTDGLIERRGEDLEARLLELARVLRDLAGEDLETLLDATIEGLAAVGRGDDVALLALRVEG